MNIYLNFHWFYFLRNSDRPTKIIKDGKLRRKIIENGRKMAEEHTMERETEMKIEIFKRYNLYREVQ